MLGFRRRRRRRKRDRAADAVGDTFECGCCLGDVFTLAAVTGGLVVWRRRRG